jgi:hypothetical protein
VRYAAGFPCGTGSGRTRVFACFLSLLLVAAAGAVLPGFSHEADAAEFERVDIAARRIGQFRMATGDTRFGPLEFVGGIELSGSSGNFGGLSALRFLSPGADFMGVADTGFWYFGAVRRDSEGRPIGIDNFRMTPITDRSGRTGSGKLEGDAEGVVVVDGSAIVAFERNHRIARFPLDPEGMGAASAELDFLVPRRELRQNRGFETVVFAEEGPLAGHLVIVTEKSLDLDGNVFAAVLEGPRKGIFTVRRSGEFDITDGAFLPGGDLLLLERSFTMLTGVSMRLRRIDAARVGPGKVADGPVLFEADMRFEIDNMEGMDVWRRHDGALMLSLVSDDNHSLLQRTIYLEFILHQD